jgi:pSer/pThr/pTyr-binding forkhead associated (FHA) protein
MKVVLQITTGDSSGRQIPVQTGEIVRFGNSNSADFSVADDQQMAAVQFALECSADQCLIRDLKSGIPTTINGKSLADTSILASGDVIQAGETSFLAEVGGAVAQPLGNEQDEEANEITLAFSAAELCDLAELEDEPRVFLLPEHSPLEFFDLLIKKSQLLDAIRLLAVWLAPRHAIHWALTCVNELSSDDLAKGEQGALLAVNKWLEEPTEEHRREAMKLAEITEFESAAGWVAGAVFWSGGSIAPPDLPEVPPDESLVAKAVTTSLLMLATQGDPEKINQSYFEIVERGCGLVTGKGD